MIQLYAPGLRAPDLKALLESRQPSTEFSLHPNPYADRSGADPTIVAAVIGAGATVLTALIALFGVVYVEHKKDRRASADQRAVEDLKMMVKTQAQQINTLIAQLGEPAARQLTETEAGEDVFDHLLLDLETAATADDPANPYYELLQGTPPERVTDLIILEE